MNFHSPKFQGLSLDKDITLLIGKNGSGKSQKLHEISVRNKDINIIAISNSVFDKFKKRESSNFKFSGARHGKSMVKKIISNALSNDYEENKHLLRKSFEYVNLEPVIIIKIELTKRFYCVDLDEDPVNFRQDFESIYLLNSIDYTLKRSEKTQYPTLSEERDFEDFIRSKSTKINEGLNTILIEHEANFDYETLIETGLFNYNKIFDFLKKLSSKISYEIIKKGHDDFFSIEDLSSGEAQLLSNLIFISTHISKEKTLIMIDEPEGSLHPKWQREFIEQLYNFFNLYSPKFLIATHSPLIISSIQESQSQSSYIGFTYSIYKIERNIAERINTDTDFSIESILWDVFEVITPENHFLSKHIIEILNKLMENQGKTKNSALEETDRLINASYNELQKDVIRSAQKIIKENF